MTDTLPDVPGLAPARDRALVETFGRLADLLLGEDDVGDVLEELLRRVVELFPVATAGLLLRAGDGRLELAGTTSEEATLLEFLQLRQREGACVDAYHAGEPVLVHDLGEEKERWPEWAPAAYALGFRGVTSIPLRMRDESVGSLNLFSKEVGHLGHDDLYAARALTQIAATAILQGRALRDAEILAAQLQHALDSRVVIEQAKGTLAERYGLSLEEAFERLRGQARREKRKIGEVAREILAG